MEWVYRYIQSFGGNPNNVTLFGESTGAGDILCHLHSAAVLIEAQNTVLGVSVSTFRLPERLDLFSGTGYHIAGFCGFPTDADHPLGTHDTYPCPIPECP